jgi:lipoyl(octanoyl) transferase
MADGGSTPGAAVEWHVSPSSVAYPAAIGAMQDRVAAIRAGTAAERVWLLEHPALYTSGTSARPEDLADAALLPTFAAGRGGQWTYHGPGQRVAYVMLDLAKAHVGVPPKDLHAYVEALEAWLIATVARFGVKGERRPGRVGIWVVDAAGRESKIAAVGVRVTRWVSWHGVSLNVCPDLSHFAGIVPCGIREHGVTSLQALGVDVGMAAVDAALRACFEAVFGVTVQDGTEGSASAMKRAASAIS